MAEVKIVVAAAATSNLSRFGFGRAGLTVKLPRIYEEECCEYVIL
jgi:hypothetical protein